MNGGLRDRRYVRGVFTAEKRQIWHVEFEPRSGSLYVLLCSPIFEGGS